MKKNPQKTEKTRALIQDSFMSLYENRDIYHITVIDICKKAGLNRSTFYLYFDSIQSLLRDIEDTYLMELHSYDILFANLDIENEFKCKLGIENIFQKFIPYAFEHKQHLKILFSPYKSPYFISKYKEIISGNFIALLKKNNTMVGNLHSHVIKFFAAGSAETMYNWLQKDDLALDEICELVTKTTVMHVFLKL